jgi:hypothetical protein
MTSQGSVEYGQVNPDASTPVGQIAVVPLQKLLSHTPRDGLQMVPPGRTEVAAGHWAEAPSQKFLSHAPPDVRQAVLSGLVAMVQLEVPLHVLVWHAPDGVQVMGVPTHCALALQVSLYVQRLPSLHAIPTATTPAEQHGVFKGVPAEQHALVSGTPLVQQTPGFAVPLLQQALVIGVWVIAPVATLQESAVQAFPSLMPARGVPMQLPKLSHVSPVVHALKSLHLVPFGFTPPVGIQIPPEHVYV